MWLGSEQAMNDRAKLMAKRGLGTYCNFLLTEVHHKHWFFLDGEKGTIENAAQSTLDWLSGLDENILVEVAEMNERAKWLNDIVRPIFHRATPGRQAQPHPSLFSPQEPPAARSQQRTGSTTQAWLRALTNVPLCRRLRLRA